MPLRNQLADFNQVATMAGRNSAAAVDGACHNFSIHWIAEMYKDASDANAQLRMQALSRNKGGASAVLQGVFGREWSRQGEREADRMICAIRGLQPGRDVFDEPYTRDALVSAINRTEVSGMSYTFWFDGAVAGAGGGSHTIAFFRRVASRRGSSAKADNVVMAFDPNYGECWIVEGNLPAWIDDLFTHYGPCREHWLKSFSPA